MDDDTILNFCGYKKSHPLEEHVNLYVCINPSSNVFNKSEEFILNALVKFMDDVIEDLITIYRDIGKESMKSL